MLPKHPKRDQAIATHREKRGPGATRRKGNGLALRLAPGGIHQSIRQLRPDLRPDCLPAAILPVGHSPARGFWRSKSRAGELSANGRGCNFEGVPCVALWQRR